MIERVYMGVDGRRDHSFRIPRPDLAGKTGSPDACTDCHADRSAGWAAGRIVQWYPERDRQGTHYGVTLARGRQDSTAAAGDLTDLAGDTSEPGIVRATALWMLQAAGNVEVAARTAPLMADTDPLVRAAAVGVQRAAPPQERVLRLVDLLDDPVRSVRMAAAREMLNAPIERLPPAMAADLREAMDAWQAALAGRLDFPETHLQLGGTALTLRNLPAAEGAFREVVRLDPQQTNAWVMLARIAAATEGVAATRIVLSEALAANPEHPTLQQLQAELDAASR